MTKIPNKAEKARIEQLWRLGCVMCAHLGKPVPTEEIHHITVAGRRLGHWYTIGLCVRCHRGRDKGDVSIASGSKAFRQIYPSERELWEKVQLRLKLSTEWPQSKRVARC